MKRVFLIVLDSVGIGHAPDAAAFALRVFDIPLTRFDMPLCASICPLRGREGLRAPQTPIYHSLNFMVREILFFCTSTASTLTFTTSPKDTAWEGCLMNLSESWEICTKPS